MSANDTKDLTVFDPPLCCSTGVCGPEVDPALARFSADLAWLSAAGVKVRRFNLAQEPGAFVADADAKAALERGEAALPLIKAGEVVVSGGAYPSRDELATWAGLRPGCAAGSSSAPDTAPAPKSGCCGPAPVEAPAPKSGCCGPAPAEGSAP